MNNMKIKYLEEQIQRCIDDIKKRTLRTGVLKWKYMRRKTKTIANL